MESSNQFYSIKFRWFVIYGLEARKHVFRICDQVRLKPACSATETSKNIEILHATSLTTKLSKVKSADQNVWMHRLVFTFAVHMQLHVFLRRGPYGIEIPNYLTLYSLISLTITRHPRDQRFYFLSSNL